MPVEAALYVLAVVILLWAGKQSGKRRSAVLIGTAAVTSLIGWFIQLMLNRNALAHITWIPSIMWQCFIVTPYFLIGMAYTLPEIRRFLSLQIAAALMAVILMFEFPPEVSPFILYFIMPYIMFSFAFAPTPGLLPVRQQARYHFRHVSVRIHGAAAGGLLVHAKRMGSFLLAGIHPGGAGNAASGGAFLVSG